ncbi:alanine--tRNA ligase [Vicingaceae bacterium]|nr:alanine--tRNA ligase [Vicingaceae bacterium]
MTSKEIRAQFLAFFKSKEHKVVDSAPMVIKNDPTLMFTNAGMNQFKDLFLGNATVKYPRITDTQKCLRVSGKHNDLEEVGVDTYHHTMFEMLGNWSFGDYFKKESIKWAWELLTEVYKLDKDSLYITVFGGDEGDQLGEDTEAYNIWKGIISEDRIIKASKKDNFWEMGDIGPCGPCSEIHVDIRSAEEKAKMSGKELVNQDHPQVIEIWNLVFMEFNRMADGSLVKLPNQHVDTGMGFERLCMALQGKQSNYDTDVFMPLINKVVKISGVDYDRTQEKKDIAIRVIADHIRAISFAISDGQLPSNTGAGYVIRRILRRAVRYGYSFLNLKEPFLNQLVEVLVSEMGDQFGELKSQQKLITQVIFEEENTFLRTLEKGIQRFEEYTSTLTGKVIDGQFAFELYDTFGFPIDLTHLMGTENGLYVDMEAFQKALQIQKERSRKATKVDAGDWVIVREDEVGEFIGYDYTSAAVKITRYRKLIAKGKESYQLVFTVTPFYPEGGGQVGDTGYIEADGVKYSITNTKKENNLIVHFADKLPENVKTSFQAEVNEKNRVLTANNHSATHLMHYALREVLGEHVEQKGSLVNSKHLRFDFSHFHKVSDEEIKRIEQRVNHLIRENIELDERRSMPINEAKAMGAMALFGEKYGDVVRLIKFGDSVELCGGTHVKSTSIIGQFKIVSESAVAVGVRRIEAITADKADEFVQSKLDLLDSINDTFKHPKDVMQSIQLLQKQNSELQKQVEDFKRAAAGNVKGELKGKIQTVGTLNAIIEKVDLDAGSIKDLAFQLKSEVANLFLVLASHADGKVTLTILVADGLVKTHDLHAGNIIRDLAKEIGGGGGGQPFFATAGGKNPSGIESALERARKLVV